MSESLKLISDTPVWYAEGLRFKCTECGACCSGGPGYTWVNPEEIQAMAQHLGLSVEEFGKQYLRKVDGRYALLERKNLQGDYDCIFLKDKKCQLYHLRPKQCRTFPWWVQNLQSPNDWQAAAQRCEGISPSAPIVPLETIQANLA